MRWETGGNGEASRAPGSPRGPRLRPGCSAGARRQAAHALRTIHSTEGVPFWGRTGQGPWWQKAPHTLEKRVTGQGSPDVPSQRQLWRWAHGRCSRSLGAVRTLAPRWWLLCSQRTDGGGTEQLNGWPACARSVLSEPGQASRGQQSHSSANSLLGRPRPPRHPGLSNRARQPGSDLRPPSSRRNLSTWMP